VSTLYTREKNTKKKKRKTHAKPRNVTSLIDIRKLASLPYTLVMVGV